MQKGGVDMARLLARDIMHPRMSLYLKDRGSDIVKKLSAGYPALPVVNDNLEVVGIVSEYDVLKAVGERKTLSEFSAETVMTCGHAEHGICGTPVFVKPDATMSDIIELFSKEKVSMLPVMENKKLIGIIPRKNILYAIMERDFWPEAEFLRKAA
jgi:CIC family chloride channel protein